LAQEGRFGRRLRARRESVNATPVNASRSVLGSLEPHQRAIVDQAQRFTMTTPERLAGLIDAVEYVIAREIPGAFAECGVWRGGSILAMVLTLQHLGVDDREVHLFDTFEGMTEPTDLDTSAYSEAALADWNRALESGQRPWEEVFGAHAFGLEQVRSVVLATGYPANQIHFVVGPVEETIPAQAPAELALLRLDTDWYESTRHELTQLYPRLSDGGVLIVDDYGHWEGCRRAIDEYFSSAPSILFTRLDYTGRLAVKH
jgi:O-methyltransferase